MEINQKYFDLLLSKYKEDKQSNITLFDGDNGEALAYAVANDEQKKKFGVVNYTDLEDISSNLKNYSFHILKMQAGLGTSVVRDDLIKSIEGRTELGAKGTDLYFEVEGALKSIAEIQLLQAQAIAKKNLYKDVIYTNLVNDQTKSAIQRIWTKGYDEAFTNTEGLSAGDEIVQQKMPTIGEDGELTTDRMAPAGHGFIGIYILDQILSGNLENQIITIGNGEDLCSSSDSLVNSWMIENNIPICMITTTKTSSDKKGGQISLVDDYVTIIEKAQAEASNQLAFFEELGLRESDDISLFNTNIVVINTKALTSLIQSFNIENACGDVIKNIKEQNGKKYTQLESALGSVMLNLDKWTRQNLSKQAVYFLNLNPSERKQFFMPIKKREDYEKIVQNFKIDSEFKLLAN